MGWAVLAGALLETGLTHGWSLDSVALSLGGVIGPWLGAWILQRQPDFDSRLRRLRDYLQLTAWGGALGSAAAALVGVGALLLLQSTTLDAATGLALRWWMGDFLGVVLIAPLLLVWWEAKRVWRGRVHPFKLPNLQLIASAQDSMALNRITGGMIIIAGSGMCNGGRIKHHLKHHLWRENTHVIFPGFQAHGTLGRQLVDGAESVRIYGEQIKVNATLHTVGGLSAHADQAGLAEWYGAIKGHPPVWLVHGENKAREIFADKLRADFGAKVGLATPGLSVEF